MMLGFGRCGLDRFFLGLSCLMIRRESSWIQHSKDYIADLLHT